MHNILKADPPDGSTALADERRSFAWQELDAHLSQATNAILSLDLGPERRIAIFAENSVETVVAHLAGILAGASTVPISNQLTAPELAYILNDSGATVLLAGPETQQVAVQAAAEASVTTVLAWRSSDMPGVSSWEDLLDAASNTGPPQTMAPLPHLHYTSGTTGRPKGVETPPTMFAGGDDIAGHLAAISRNPMLMIGGTALVVGPSYHTGPLSTIRGVLGGMGSVVLDRFDPVTTLRTIQDHRITTCVMVPTHFQRLLAVPEAERAAFDTSSLAVVIHTGAACPRDVKQAMIDWWGPVLFEAYGGTESGTTNTISSLEWLQHPGSVGRTIAPFEVLIVGDDGSEVEVGGTGQIYFSDTSGRGVIFHNDAEKTNSVHLADGVFTLGEIGHVDADGYLYITDRASDMIVSGGVNIYPAEAEQALLRHDAVADVACIGVPDDDKGERLMALIVATNKADAPDEDELLEYCRVELANYKVPRSITFVDDLGRNAMGKLSKRQLRAPYWPTERTIGG